MLNTYARNITVYTLLKDTLASNLCHVILVKHYSLLRERKKVLDMKMTCLPNPDMLVYVYIEVHTYTYLSVRVYTYAYVHTPLSKVI